MLLHLYANQYLLPHYLLNESFEKGRYNQAPDGNDNFGDYTAGQNARKMYEERATLDFGDNSSNTKINPGNGGGGGGIIAWLFLAIFIIPMAVVSIITSFIIAFIIQKYMQQADRDTWPPEYGEAYSISFRTTFFYQITTALVLLLLYALLSSHVQLPFLQASDPSTVSNNFILITVFYQLPAVLISSLHLRWKLRNYALFYGFSGYLRAAVITLLVYLPLISVASFYAWKIAMPYITALFGKL